MARPRTAASPWLPPVALWPLLLWRSPDLLKHRHQVEVVVRLLRLPPDRGHLNGAHLDLLARGGYRAGRTGERALVRPLPDDLGGHRVAAGRYPLDGPLGVGEGLPPVHRCLYSGVPPLNPALCRHLFVHGVGGSGGRHLLCIALVECRDICLYRLDRVLFGHTVSSLVREQQPTARYPVRIVLAAESEVSDRPSEGGRQLRGLLYWMKPPIAPRWVALSFHPNERVWTC